MDETTFEIKVSCFSYYKKDGTIMLDLVTFSMIFSPKSKHFC